MKTGLCRIVAALAAVCLAAGLCGAQEGGNRMLLLAEAVVTGKAIDQRPSMLEGEPVTLVRFAVTKTLKGKVPAELTVVLPGGIYKPGKVRVDTGSDGSVRLEPAEEALLFLDPVAGVAGGYTVAVPPYGKFSIRTDARGGKSVDRLFAGVVPKGGAPLSQLEKEIAEALEGSGAKAPAPR